MEVSQQPQLTVDPDSLIRDHLSPAPTCAPFADPYLDRPDQSRLFYFLSEREIQGQRTGNFSDLTGGDLKWPLEISPKEPVFWGLVERFAEELFALDAFKRLDDIYVNPQFACTARGESEHILNDLVGRMTRAAHVRDVVRIAIYTMKAAVDSGARVSSEEIFMTVFSSFCHDIMVSAFSHLSQDDLKDRGIDVDHDLLLAFGVSQQWAQEVCGRWGLDHKRMVAACLPPTLLLAEPRDRKDDWQKLADTLNRLIEEDPETWSYYKKKRGFSEISSVIDFSPGSEDEKLLSEKRIIRSSQRAHDLFDLAYARTDHTQRELLELEGVSLLSHGKLDTSRICGSLREIDLMELPHDLRHGLVPRGREPSGDLYTCFIVGAGNWLHLALVEKKSDDYVVRALTDSLEELGEVGLEADGKTLSPDVDMVSQGWIAREPYLSRLKRVKVTKSVSNYYDLLGVIHPLGDGSWSLSNIRTFLRTFLALGDYQSSRVAHPKVTVGRAFFASASKHANGGKGISPLHHIFGDHPTCVNMFLEEHKNALEKGYDSCYLPIVSVRPFSSRAGRLWCGKTAPREDDISKLFEGFSDIAKWLQEEVSRKGGEIIHAPSAIVSKRYELMLSDEAKSELRERALRSKSRVSDWIYRRAREEDDQFSIAFYVEGGGRPVTFFFRLHRGFEVAIHKDHERFLTADIREELRKRVSKLVGTSRIREGNLKTTVPVERIFRVEYFDSL